MAIQFRQIPELIIQELYGRESQAIKQLSFHSGQVQPGAVFFSMKGETHNGDEYIEEAIQRGAKAVIGANRERLLAFNKKYPECTFIVVHNVRLAMAAFARYYFNYADEALTTVGVTGTNGKTTVTAFVRSLLTLLGLPAGSIGTTGIWSSEKKLDYKKSTPTTPESAMLHQAFHDLKASGDRAAAMEVSSIAIDQLRVACMRFDVAVHTNISEEHLEYHKTFEHYKMCKMKLFDQAERAVVNFDDPEMGHDLIKSFQRPILTYSLESPAADLYAENIDMNDSGTTFDLFYKGDNYAIQTPVYGEYNVANVLSAVGTALHLGFDIRQIASVLPHLDNPEGRFQVIEGPENRKIILDYAHTPVALTRLVHEVKKLVRQRLIVMIAGIGIRDFEKMPKMARVIEGKADEIIVTVDHPGDHEPEKIVKQVMTGFSDPHAVNIHQTRTRKDGVLKALSLGQPGDIILLTSGCINGAQIVKGREIPHSDEAIINTYFESPQPS